MKSKAALFLKVFSPGHQIKMLGGGTDVWTLYPLGTGSVSKLRHGNCNTYPPRKFLNMLMFVNHWSKRSALEERVTSHGHPDRKAVGTQVADCQWNGSVSCLEKSEVEGNERSMESKVWEPRKPATPSCSRSHTLSRVEVVTCWIEEAFSVSLDGSMGAGNEEQSPCILHFLQVVCAGLHRQVSKSRLWGPRKGVVEELNEKPTVPSLDLI